MNNLKYSIVEFCDDEGVALVCNKWIFDSNGTTSCYCPPLKNSALCNRAAERCQPPEPSWKAYECKIMYSTDDYAKARLKLHDAEVTSNLESEMEAADTENQRRKRGLGQRYAESSDIDPPAKKIPIKTMKSAFMPTPPAPPPPSPHPMSKIPPSDSETTPRSVGTGRNCAFERHVLTLLQELKDSVAELKNGMAIMATQRSKACLETSPEEMPDGVSLPLDNTEEVAALELKLTEDTNLRQLVIRNISSIGGSSMGDSTRRVLRQIFTNRCARLLNWKGRGGKMALSGLSLTSVIIKAVRMNAVCANASHAEIESHIKDWLKFATEREGGRKMRVEKK